MSTATNIAHARSVLTVLAKMGGRVTGYIGEEGLIDAVGYIDKDMDFIGGDIVTADSYWRAHLLVDDVGTPHRGDRIIDEDSKEWELLTEIPQTDDQIVNWSVRLK